MSLVVVVAVPLALAVGFAAGFVTQVCAVCQVNQCPDWRAARDRLLAIDELTTPAPHYPAVADFDRKPRP